MVFFFLRKIFRTDIKQNVACSSMKYSIATGSSEGGTQTSLRCWTPNDKSRDRNCPWIFITSQWEGQFGAVIVKTVQS